MVLEALGVVAFVVTIWSALKFEGEPGQESSAGSDDRGALVVDERTERIPELQIPDAPAAAMMSGPETS
jgi:hypothetical protein